MPLSEVRPLPTPTDRRLSSRAMGRPLTTEPAGSVGRSVVADRPTDRAAIGWVRLVNPDRGLVRAAVSGRLLALNLAGETWEIAAVSGGCHYHPGRGFPGRDLAAWADPTRGGPPVDPSGWNWRTYGPWGVDVLRPRPDAAELADVARAALRAAGADDPAGLPLLDRFEVWACERSSRRPIALVATALSLAEALDLGFGPGPLGRLTDRFADTDAVWRLGDRPGLDEAARVVQTRVNDRIGPVMASGLAQFDRRVFERSPDGSTVEHDHGRILPVPPGVLPSGPLAEPFESERLALVR